MLIRVDVVMLAAVVLLPACCLPPLWFLPLLFAPFFLASAASEATIAPVMAAMEPPSKRRIARNRLIGAVANCLVNASKSCPSIAPSLPRGPDLPERCKHLFTVNCRTCATKSSNIQYSDYTLCSGNPPRHLVIMPDTGHFALFEQPAEFSRIVLASLAGEAIATPTV